MSQEANDQRFESAVALFEANRLPEASDLCRQILRDSPNDLAALSLRGVLAVQLGDQQSALESFRRVVELNPRDVSALSNYGNVLKDLGQYDLAIAHYNQAIVLDPKFAQAHYNMGIIQARLHFYPEAIACFTAAIQQQPEWAECYLNRGNAYQAQRNLDAALQDYNRVIALRPASTQGYVNRANLRHPSTGVDGAQHDLVRALQLEPNQPAVLYNYAQLLHSIGNYEGAAQILERLNQVAPSESFALGEWLHCKMLIADWKNWTEINFELRVRLAMKQAVVRPFGLMGLSHSELELQSCARIYSALKHPPVSLAAIKRSASASTKIRLGYIGGEFRTQAISLLMTGIYELHDPARFEIYAFDNGWDDGGELRRRQNLTFKKIFDISKLGDKEAAQLIADNEIDILIDLSGFFGLGRQGVLAFKPSPIQVGYLGCPGTMGAEYMDYLIADNVVIPEASTPCYDEKIIRLPHSYYPCDHRREVSAQKFTRTEMGLPEGGFVFCCFNNNYKILPETFSQWMRILQKVPGSVLWLFETSPASVAHLRQEAEKRGVEPDRLVFAKPLPPPEHLARHTLADLFLDTLPYNAHTTASDALWMGLPLITQVGTTFPGRVAASMLRALDVPELITDTPEAYEALAVELASHPAKLNALKQKILSHRQTKPLFDTKMFMVYYERALIEIHQLHRAGLKPEARRIDP